MKKIKLAFVWDFHVEPMMLYGWDDGLKKALEILSYEEGWDIKVIADDVKENIYAQIREFKPDVILCWGGLDRTSFNGIKEFRVPTALCFAGGSTQHPNVDNFDIVFTESQIYEDAFKKQGVNYMRAMGTNDYLFQPLKLKKKFKAFFGSTYSNWKRFFLFAMAVGDRGITAGRILKDEIQNLEVCVENGVTVLTEVSCQNMPYLYNQSEFALIPSAFGGQRNVLEAMACNVIPIVMSDNPVTVEYVKESGYGVIVDPEVEDIKEALSKTYEFKTTGREYVLEKYSAKKYAEALKKGIESIL